MPSRIPDVVSYLVAQCSALTATTLAGVLVQDGPPLAGVVATGRVLVIGGEWQPSDIARPGATASQTPSVGNASRDEEISISCSGFAQSGDTDIATRRAEVFAIVAAIENMLAADQTLGGLAYSTAQVASVDAYRPIQNERGSAAIVDFTITATALLWDG